MRSRPVGSVASSFVLIPRPILTELADALDAIDDGLRLATVEVDIDPLDLVRAGHEAFGFSAFFASPEGRSVGALGTAQVLATSGPDRLRRLDTAVAELPVDAPIVAGFAFASDGPTGTAWEGFPGATAVVPIITVRRSGGRSRLTIAVPPGSDGRMLLSAASTLRVPGPVGDVVASDPVIESRPGPSDWTETVAEAVGAIGAGALQKVVLARSVVMRTTEPVEPFDVVSHLRDRYPSCRVFGWQVDGGTFVGASPELLVARSGDHFHLSPLAGSAPRGVDADDDRRLGDELLASSKDRVEHDIVVEDAVRRLRPLAETVDFPSEPQLQRFATVQHLATPIQGSSGSRTLVLADALHPTPAVGGAPRSDALAFIDKREGLDRGWYAGGIGWLEAGGDGELALGLRCALLRGDTALLYAGNGIVAASDPEAELAETRLKLRTLLDLFQG